MKDIVNVALYVDNNLMIGDKTAIDDAILALKNKGLVLKVVEGLQDYLSCKIKFSEKKKHAWLGQPHLIKNSKSKFEKLIKYVGRLREGLGRRSTNLPIRRRYASVFGEAF